MTPVIFLHGIGGGARSFAPQIASFASAGYQPVALDLMGYGAREPVEAMSFAALAEDVEFAISESGLKGAVLVGHSMGGMVVQTMLRRKPEAYRAAVLSCTSPAFGNPAGDFQKKFVADRLEPLDTGYTMADVAPATMRGMMGPNADPAGAALFVEEYAKVPVLCLAAELDRNAPPPVLEKMAAKIPGARYVCLPGLGHMPNLEAPPAFDAAIFNFLNAVLAAAP